MEQNTIAMTTPCRIKQILTTDGKTWHRRGLVFVCGEATKPRDYFNFTNTKMYFFE